MNVVLTPLRTEYRAGAAAGLGLGLAVLLAALLVPEQRLLAVSVFLTGTAVSSAASWHAQRLLPRVRHRGHAASAPPTLGVRPGPMPEGQGARPPPQARRESYADALRRQLPAALGIFAGVAAGLAVGYAIILASSGDTASSALVTAALTGAGSQAAGFGLYHVFCAVWAARCEQRTGLVLLLDGRAGRLYAEPRRAGPSGSPRLA